MNGSFLGAYTEDKRICFVYLVQQVDSTYNVKTFSSFGLSPFAKIPSANTVTLSKEHQEMEITSEVKLKRKISLISGISFIIGNIIGNNLHYYFKVHR